MYFQGPDDNEQCQSREHIAWLKRDCACLNFFAYLGQHESDYNRFSQCIHFYFARSSYTNQTRPLCSVDSAPLKRKYDWW